MKKEVTIPKNNYVSAFDLQDNKVYRLVNTDDVGTIIIGISPTRSEVVGYVLKSNRSPDWRLLTKYSSRVDEMLFEEIEHGTFNMEW